MAPPQHGKSRAAEDFIAWVAGRNPDLKIIYASFSDDLGVRTNLSQQRTIANQRYQLALGNTRIDVNGWICSSDLLEFAGRAGCFAMSPSTGAVNGMELHLGVIDDPVKGRAQAHSQSIRDRTCSKIELWGAAAFSQSTN